jgi:hypothetical protein
MGRPAKAVIAASVHVPPFHSGLSVRHRFHRFILMWPVTLVAVIPFYCDVGRG